MSDSHSSEFNWRATVSNSREVTLTVDFKRVIALPHPLTAAQEVEFFTRLGQSGIKEILTDTMEWAITGVEQ